jgi:formamidopyrimidine-DNA glycosylase
MPELPEVQTTVNGLNKTVKGLKIVDVWTDYKSSHKMFKGSIKEPKFFSSFKNQVKNKKILNAERRAKNILIHLTGNKTILIHMKMTGHLMYGKYEKVGNKWKPKGDGPLADPFNQFIHLIFILSNGRELAFSDMRKFAKVTIINTDKLNESLHVSELGPEPLDKKFTFEIFKKRLLKKPKSKIKTTLMDQTLISGIGNIYSDEILWRAGVHPLSIVGKIPEKNLKEMYKATKETLKKGIDFGGDSMSDYRNIYGERGKFQEHHRAYRKTGKKCQKPKCRGVIKRIVVGSRSAHFCPVHQKLFK